MIVTFIVQILNDLFNFLWQGQSEWSHWKWRYPAPCLLSSRRCWRTLRDWRGMELWEGKEEEKAKAEAEKRMKQSLGAVSRVRRPNQSLLPAQARLPTPLLLLPSPSELLHAAPLCYTAPPCGHGLVLQENHSQERHRTKAAKLHLSLENNNCLTL